MLMSVAKTIGQVRDGMEIRVREGLQVRGRSEWHDLPDIRDGVYDIRGGRLYKDVTRRGGWHKETGKAAVWRPTWCNANAGDVVELIEWSSRVPIRWACSCGWLGSTKLGASNSAHECFPGLSLPVAGRIGRITQKSYRSPLRLGVRRVAAVDQVRLGDISRADVVREGFPEMTPEEFVRFYCAPGKPYPDGRVTRIELSIPLEEAGS